MSHFEYLIHDVIRSNIMDDFTEPHEHRLVFQQGVEIGSAYSGYQ